MRAPLLASCCSNPPHGDECGQAARFDPYILQDADLRQVARDRNRRIPIGRLFEDGIRVAAAVVATAAFGKPAAALSGALDRLEVLFGNDHLVSALIILSGRPPGPYPIAL